MDTTTEPFQRAAERFWTKVDKSGDCWTWQAGIGHYGYGSFRARLLLPLMGYREQLAHRWSWIFTHGPIPPDECVLHACDNPPCVRPDHLRLGSHQDNVADREARNRRDNRGIRNSQVVLSEDDVRTIRRIYVAGSKTVGSRALGRRYGVSQPTISMLINRKTWPHLS